MTDNSDKTPNKKVLIVTVHGIRTKLLKSWQTDMWSFLKRKCPDSKIVAYNYGFLLAPVSYWVVLSRKLKIPSYVRRFLITRLVIKLKKLKAKFPDYEISILAHSFGTWMAYYALNREEDLEVRNLVLVQGVISSHVEKLNIINWLEMGKVKKVFAWSSRNDAVVCLAALPPFGKLGCRGFVRKGVEEDYLKPDKKPYSTEIYNIQTNEDHHGVLNKFDIYGEVIAEQLTC